MVRMGAMRRSGGAAFQADGTACAKALGQDCTWGVFVIVRSPVWLELSERERRR